MSRFSISSLMPRWWIRSGTTEPLPSSSTVENKGLLESDECCHHCRYGNVSISRNSLFLSKGILLANIITFVVLICTVVYTLMVHHDGCVEPSTNERLKKVSAYSPILDDFKFSLNEKKMNGKIKDTTSIWRMPPSAQVDAAWNHISMEEAELIAVTKEEVEKSGKNASLAIQIPLDWHQGRDKYLAQVEVFHNIHCLDELRKEMWSDHYYKGQEADDVRRTHKAHCLHMILQTLMCSADVGIITHNWIYNELWPGEEKIRLGPDFNIQKQCRNFDSLLDWMYSKAIRNTTSLVQGLKWQKGMAYLSEDGYSPPTHYSATSVSHEVHSG